MIKLIVRASFLFAFLIFLSLQWSVNFESSALHPSQQVMNTQEIPKNLKISPNYGQIPLYFIPNEGQLDEKALYYAKTSRYTLWFTKEGLIFDSIRREYTKDDRSHPPHLRQERKPKESTCERDVSRMHFLNANKDPEVIPINQTEHKVNYFRGNDKSKWRTTIQTSRAVLYKELYRNIDLKVYGMENRIEYDFIVKPRGEVSDIQFEYSDVESTRIDREGILVIKTEFGELEHAKPLCYQVIGGERVGVKAEFKKIENNTYGFEVEDYNKNYELIIDPVVLVYSTYLGGSDLDSAYDIALDSEGTAYVTGKTYSLDFPIKNAMQGSNAGDRDVFITKINPSGTEIVYSTYIGGSGKEEGNGIAVDAEGAAYVVGSTLSLDFPLKNPIQDSLKGPRGDAFVTKINSLGTDLVYSTYLGGTQPEWGSGDYGNGIAVDAEGAAYVTGETNSLDFPTKNPIQEEIWGMGDWFITKINPTGTALVYSSVLGDMWWDCGSDIAVDSEGAAYVTGTFGLGDYPWGHPKSIFVAKINPSGSAFSYFTCCGGHKGWYWGEGIAIDMSGAAYVTGHTDLSHFDWYWGGSNNGDLDVVIYKISPAGTLSYSFLCGGSDGETAQGIAVDSEGAAYVTGYTHSDDFPTKNPIQGSKAGGRDTFIVKISPTGDDIVSSTYLGGSGDDLSYGIALDSERAVYVTGGTNSDDFHTKNPIQGSKAGGWDVFITKLCFSTHSLTLAAGTNGTTDPPPGTYDFCARSEVVIEAISDEGFGFSRWSRDATGTDNPITIVMDSNKSIKANFVPQYSLTINSGTGGTTDPVPGTYLYNKGTKVTITTIPDTHYRFRRWSGDVRGTSNPKTITINADKSVTANFIRIIYPPSNFSGQKVLNRSLSQAEYINVLSWQSNTNNENIQNYRIYLVDGQSQSLLVELNANAFEYWHRGVEKATPYTYAIVAVNNEGREGDPAYVTVQ